ncbi:CrcB family protein [Actinomadura sp. 1N219]|uniref:CrcB family protein n=1 Tax=Actinomadura sp. 1N219 TaxID=3375152 RepID=UPI00379FC6D6
MTNTRLQRGERAEAAALHPHRGKPPPPGLKPRVIAEIAMGGALGALSRYGLGEAIPTAKTGFAWNTFTINMLACLVMGVLTTYLLSGPPHRFIRPFAVTGYLGGFSTFSHLLQNDDVAIQDGGGSYIRGYSAGAQERWLERELRRTRADRGIDWIVVCMHQVAISTADGNGADLGVRRSWLPLFDKYGVDLVVCGHEHHYERSLPIRGHQSNSTMTPIPVSSDLRHADTSKGTVHMVIGGGGMGHASNGLLYEKPEAKVIVDLSDERDPEVLNHLKPIYVKEPAPWSAFRDRHNPYGFCAFDVDPGHRGGTTRITVTYYAVTGNGSRPVDRFVLERPRRD